MFPNYVEMINTGVPISNPFVCLKLNYAAWSYISVIMCLIRGHWEQVDEGVTLIEQNPALLDPDENVAQTGCFPGMVLLQGPGTLALPIHDFEMPVLQKCYQ